MYNELQETVLGQVATFAREFIIREGSVIIRTKKYITYEDGWTSLRYQNIEMTPDGALFYESGVLIPLSEDMAWLGDTWLANLLRRRYAKKIMQDEFQRLADALQDEFQRLADLQELEDEAIQEKLEAEATEVGRDVFGRWAHVCSNWATYDALSTITGEICVTTPISDQLFKQDCMIVMFEGRVRRLFHSDVGSSREPDGTRAAHTICSMARPEGWLVPAEGKIVAIIGDEKTIKNFGAPESVHRIISDISACEEKSLLVCKRNRKNMEKLRELGRQFRFGSSWRGGRSRENLLFIGYKADVKGSWTEGQVNNLTGKHILWHREQDQ